jgi:hypothetical protein
MKKKDWIAAGIGVAIAFLLVWKVVLGGSFENPFVPKLNLKVSQKVDCWEAGGIYSYCYGLFGFSNYKVTFESKPLFGKLVPFSLITEPADIFVDVSVKYPDGTIRTAHQEQHPTQPGWYDFYFSFPTPLKGVYHYKITTCYNWLTRRDCQPIVEGDWGVA